MSLALLFSPQGSQAIGMAWHATTVVVGAPTVIGACTERAVGQVT